MATQKELKSFYKQIYDKDLPSSTLSKWVKNGRIKVRELSLEERKGGERYDYDLQSFKNIILSESYSKRFVAVKQKPEDFIGKVSGQLKIVRVVPENERQSNYKGTLMYCQCLRCKRPDLV